MSEPRSSAPAARRSQILSWALWDFGSTGLNAVVVTFVFSIYLTNAVGDGLPGGISPTSWLGWALGAAGLAVALLGPDDRGVGRRAMAARRHAGGAQRVGGRVDVGDEPGPRGLPLPGGSVWCWWPPLGVQRLATVPYNAMLRQLSTPQTSGQISGFGMGLGYFGSVVLLLGGLLRVRLRRW